MAAAVRTVKESPAVPDLKDLQQRLRKLEQAKAIAEDRKQRALAEQERIRKMCREQFDLEPNELEEKMKQVEKDMEKKKVELNKKVSAIEKALGNAAS